MSQTCTCTISTLTSFNHALVTSRQTLFLCVHIQDIFQAPKCCWRIWNLRQRKHIIIRLMLCQSTLWDWHCQCELLVERLIIFRVKSNQFVLTWMHFVFIARCSCSTELCGDQLFVPPSFTLSETYMKKCIYCLSSPQHPRVCIFLNIIYFRIEIINNNAGLCLYCEALRFGYFKFCFCHLLLYVRLITDWSIFYDWAGTAVEIMNFTVILDKSYG